MLVRLWGNVPTVETWRLFCPLMRKDFAPQLFSENSMDGAARNKTTVIINLACCVCCDMHNEFGESRPVGKEVLELIRLDILY